MMSEPMSQTLVVLMVLKVIEIHKRSFWDLEHLGFEQRLIEMG